MKVQIKKKLLFLIPIILLIAIYIPRNMNQKGLLIKPNKSVKKGKKSQEQRRLFVQERLEHELKMQRNPQTREIPLDEKNQELRRAREAKEKNLFKKATSSIYVSRGPTNLGGRTRALKVDISDASSNTIIAGGVSSGLFRTTNGGTSWTKVSSNSEIHNVTAVAQDPRSGFQNIWYYATGERQGISASLGTALFRGQGVWKSTDSGVTWNQIAVTNSAHDIWDSPFDYITAIEVSPTNGDLFIASQRTIYRYDGTALTLELEQSPNGFPVMTDVAINSAGRVFAAFAAFATTHNGVWTSPTGNGSWTRIAQKGNPVGWETSGGFSTRVVLSTAPSNNDIIYALYENGNLPGSDMVEADLWKYDLGTSTWTNYTSKLPDEPGGNLLGNDPFAIQGGYDLVVSVKPDDENFVLIGGTNAYKIEDITTNSTFTRIGGYLNNRGYALYNVGGNKHHADIHVLEFDPNNPKTLFSGTDGGVHRTPDITLSSIAWSSLNNNYQTFQYYHVAMDPEAGGNTVLGGAQDNGTTYGGTDAGQLTNNTEMIEIAGGDGTAVGIAIRTPVGTMIPIQFYYSIPFGNMRTNLPLGRRIDPTGSESQFVAYFYLDPDNTNALYYAGLLNSDTLLEEAILYKTTDAENVTRFSWTNMGSLPTNERLRTFSTTRGAYNAASSYLLIGGEQGGIFRLNDPHGKTDLSTAVNITPTGASTAAESVVSGLAIHPTNPDIVLATYSNYGITNIFLTTNATATTPTWTVVERNLASHSIRSAAIAVAGSQIIYFVGTARGLYSSTDPTTTDWDIEGANEIGFALVSGLVYRPSDNKLLIGTHGNGMYETTVVASPLSTNSVSNSELGVTVYPNPVASELNITGSKINFNDAVKYQISDVTGKLIQKGTLKNKKVDVQTLVSGMYIINLEANGLKGSLKFLKK